MLCKCLMLYFFRNSTGHVVSAESVRSVWRTTFDPKDKLTDATAEFGITGSDIYLADQHTMTFERTLIGLFANFSDELAGEPGMDFDLLYSTPRRWVGFSGHQCVHALHVFGSLSASATAWPRGWARPTTSWPSATS